MWTMNYKELKKDFYWTGVLDKDLRVFDIIMHTEFGTTYNSYVLKTDDKVVLFETAKIKFFDSYLESLKEIVDINKIDYIIVNHTEPDHSGSIEKLIDINPNIKIVGSTVAINFLKNIILPPEIFLILAAEVDFPAFLLQLNSLNLMLLELTA